MDQQKKEPRFHGEVSENSHKNMSRICGRDTSIEVTLRKALWAKGHRYRKNYRKLPGKPDIALTKYKIAVFCDGEFFHGKDWDVLRTKLKSGKNPDYWITKIERNIERDREKDILLQDLGWTVLHFWGNEIKKNTEGCVAAIEETILKLQATEVDCNESL